MSPFDEKELFWASGFLEGEGSFLVASRTLRVSAAQVNREPLERLMNLFGGNITVVNRQARREKGSNEKDFFVLQISGTEALIAMIYLFPQMSAKRKEQIRNALGERGII